MTTADADLERRVAEAICREKCAYYGDPPCFVVGDGLSEDCDEPGCIWLARVAIAAMQEPEQEDRRDG